MAHPIENNETSVEQNEMERIMELKCKVVWEGNLSEMRRGRIQLKRNKDTSKGV